MTPQNHCAAGDLEGQSARQLLTNAQNPPADIEVTPPLLGMLANMPQDIAKTFTSAQLSALAGQTRMSGPHHTVDLIVSLPFFWRRYYLRVLFGKERRSIDRLLREGQIDLGKTVVVYAAAAWLTVSLAAFATVLALYLVKSAMGINLMAGRSPLHFIYEAVFR